MLLKKINFLQLRYCFYYPERELGFLLFAFILFPIVKGQSVHTTSLYERNRKILNSLRRISKFKRIIVPTIVGPEN